MIRRRPVSFHLHGTDVSAMVDVYRQTMVGRAYISPVARGWISLYDRDAELQSLTQLESYGSIWSRRLRTTVWAVQFDTTSLEYMLHANGRVEDRYSTCPDDGFPGHTERLLAVLQSYAPPTEVADLLGEAEPHARLRDPAAASRLLGAFNDRFKQNVPQVEESLRRMQTAFRAMPVDAMRAALISMGLPGHHPAITGDAPDSSTLCGRVLADHTLLLAAATVQRNRTGRTPTEFPVVSSLFEGQVQRLLGLAQVVGLEPVRAFLSYSHLLANRVAAASRSGFEEVQGT